MMEEDKGGSQTQRGQEEVWKERKMKTEEKYMVKDKCSRTEERHRKKVSKCKVTKGTK